MNRGILGLVVLLAIVGAFMYVGYAGSRGLALRLRVASALIPPLALVGGGLVFFVLTACGLGDVFTTAQRARCETISSIGVPAAGGYLLLVAASWIMSLIAHDDPPAQRMWLRVASRSRSFPTSLL
jgi:hypothetical protein